MLLMTIIVEDEARKDIHYTQDNGNVGDIGVDTLVARIVV